MLNKIERSRRRNTLIHNYEVWYEMIPSFRTDDKDFGFVLNGDKLRDMGYYLGHRVEAEEPESVFALLNGQPQHEAHITWVNTGIGQVHRRSLSVGDVIVNVSQVYLPGLYQAFVVGSYNMVPYHYMHRATLNLPQYPHSEARRKALIAYKQLKGHGWEQLAHLDLITDISKTQEQVLGLLAKRIQDLSS